MGSAFRRSLLDLQSADTEAGGAPFQDAFTIFLLKVIPASFLLKVIPASASPEHSAGFECNKPGSGGEQPMRSQWLS
jgi:hypothetical protein